MNDAGRAIELREGDLVAVAAWVAMPSLEAVRDA